jgi:hypothetical protein
VSNPTDTRIPPTGGSGTAPPKGWAVLPNRPPTAIIEPSPAAYDGLIAHLRAEIDRLTTLHRAEQEHNRRLSAACSLYRSAACTGLTAMWSVPVTQHDFSNEIDSLKEDTVAADHLAIPTATEVPS